MRQFITTIIFFTSILIITGCTNQDNKEDEKDSSIEIKKTIMKDVNVQEANDLIQENKDNSDFIILDVRTPEEFQEGYIENAINIDYYSDSFKEELDKLNKTKTYLIYCKSGNRSGKTLNLMEKLNFEKVHNIQGGIISWKSENYSTVSE